MILPCYLHSKYIIFTYFASFTGYEDDIFEVISSLHMKGSKFGGKFKKIVGKSLKKINSAEFMEFVFSKSVLNMPASSAHILAFWAVISSQGWVW